MKGGGGSGKESPVLPLAVVASAIVWALQIAFSYRIFMHTPLPGASAAIFIFRGERTALLTAQMVRPFQYLSTAHKLLCKIVGLAVDATMRGVRCAASSYVEDGHARMRPVLRWDGRHAHEGCLQQAEHALRTFFRSASPTRRRRPRPPTRAGTARGLLVRGGCVERISPSLSNLNPGQVISSSSYESYRNRSF